jgi:hypothetical protein
MISTSGICRFCRCLSLIAVSPFRIPIFQLIPSSKTTSSMALPISFARARSGITQSSCKPFLLFDW